MLSVTLFLVYTVRHVQWVSSDCDVMHYDVIWILLCHTTVHDTVVAGKFLHNSLVYNVICHCQGAYGAERLWEGSLNYNTRPTEKSPVRQQNAWFDRKKPGSTEKCPVRQKNALPRMHQLTLPLSNIPPRPPPPPSSEKYFFPIFFPYFFKNQ